MKSFSVLLLALPPLSGAIAFLAATTHGIGIYSDSAMYLLTARSLIHGLGWTIDGIPVTIFPPLYPAFLALSGLSGADPIDGARWLQAGVWACNIFWVGIITLRFSGKSLTTSLLASIAMLGAVDMLAYHLIALSDGLFLFFSLPGLLAISIYLEKEKTQYLIISALLFSLALLTRYVGWAWIGAGALSIVLLSNKDIKGKLKDGFLFAILSGAPSIPWTVRNMQQATVMGRTFDIHRFGGDQEFASLIHTVAAWFFQWSVPDSAWMIPLPALFIVLLIRWLWTEKHLLTNELKRRVYLLVVFVAVYAAVLILSAVFIQADLFRDSPRLMMPLHVLILITGLICVQSPFKKKYSTGVRFKIIEAVMFLSISIFILATGTRYLLRVSSDGQGYASSAYRNSQLLNKIKTIPQGITIYSNLDLPIALYTGRMLMSIPEKINNTTQRWNEQYDSLMKSMAGDIRDSSAVLVYFSRRNDWLVYPTLEEIQKFVSLHCIDSEKDGVIYEASPDTTEDQ